MSEQASVRSPRSIFVGTLPWAHVGTFFSDQARRKSIKAGKSISVRRLCDFGEDKGRRDEVSAQAGAR